MGMGGAGWMWLFRLLPVVGVLVLVVAQRFAVRHRPHRTDGEQGRSPR